MIGAVAEPASASESFLNVQEHLSKQDGGVTLDALIRNDIVALLCCPLTSGEAPVVLVLLPHR